MEVDAFTPRRELGVELGQVPPERGRARAPEAQVVQVLVDPPLLQRGTELGFTAAESTAKAGMLFDLSQLVGLLWAYPIGIILDRLPRMTAMCIAFGLATLGYFAIGQIDDPFGRWIPLACILVGMGESSAMIAGGVMIGQEAPAKARGAVLGTYSLMGAAGIMILVFIGGFLFDKVGKTAPFIMMGFINLVVLAGALWFRQADARKAALSPNPAE